MIWFGLAVAAVGVLFVVVVYQVASGVAEVRKHATRWEALANTQRKHEFDIRIIRDLIHPMARTGQAPLPQHLRQENQP